jgi:thymidine kinase
MSAIKKGKIELILGPMFSGKTTELLRRLECFLMRKKKAAEGGTPHVFKYAKDTRYTEVSVSTHDKLGQIKWQYPAIPLYTFVGYDDSHIVAGDMVFIDEGQFYDNSVPAFVESLAQRGVSVVISALSGDFKRNPFPAISDLQAKATSHTYLTAICHDCDSDAQFTRKICVRIEDAELVESIGGSDKYEAVCLQHHFW